MNGQRGESQAKGCGQFLQSHWKSFFIKRTKTAVAFERRTAGILEETAAVTITRMREVERLNARLFSEPCLLVSASEQNNSPLL
jgi:hypothetical protein